MSIIMKAAVPSSSEPNRRFELQDGAEKKHPLVSKTSTTALADGTPYGVALPSEDVFRDPPVGFYCPKIFRYEASIPSSSEAQISDAISGMCKIRPWEEFDDEVRNAWDAAVGILGEDCASTMSNAECPNVGCRKIAATKEEIALTPLLSEENDMYPYLTDLCKGLVQILREEDGAWNVRVKGRVEVVSGMGLGITLNGSPRVLSGDVAVVDANLVGNPAVHENRTPEVFIEAKLPFYALDIPDRIEARTETRQRPIHERYQRVLDRAIESREFYSTWIRKAFCQTVLEAVHTRSGRAGLTTMREGIFIHVPGLNADGTVDVRISDVFKYNGDIGLLRGMLGFLRSSQSTYGNGNVVQRDLAHIATNLPRRHNERTTEERERVLQDTPAGAAIRRHAGNASGGGSNAPNGMVIMSGGRGYKRDGMLQAKNAGSGLEQDWSLCLSRVEQERLRSEMEEGKVLILDKDLMLRAFTMGPQQFLAVGLSGIATKVIFNGLPVVVKIWNYRNKDGLRSLRNEAGLYKYLLKAYPDVLGKAVPRVVAMCVETERDTAIVTEYVGEEIRQEFGGYNVGGRKLSPSDMRLISSAAAKSLVCLARCGIVHNDEEVRNLRVEFTGKKGQQWRAWWIDLGSAYLMESPKQDSPEMFQAEKAAMRWRLC